MPWTTKSNLDALLHLQATGRVRAAPLLTHRFPVERAAEAADLLIDHPEPVLGVVLTYGVELESLEPGMHGAPTDLRVEAVLVGAPVASRPQASS